MIYILYGEDDLRLDESLASLRDSIEPAELRDVNVSVLYGAEVGFDELRAGCDTVPFMAANRMVIVRGLLTLFEPRPRPRSESRGASSKERAMGPWAALPEYLPAVPPTTLLVFVDGRLTQRNPLLAKVHPLAEVRTFPLPRRRELGQWIRQRARRHEMEIEPGAVDALVEMIGPKLRIIDMELQKLALYRWGRPVRRRDVQDLASYAKEASIFAAVDAVLEGRPGEGIRQVHQLLDSGRTSSSVISMIARQVRLLLLAKELGNQGLPQTEIGGRLSLSGFPLRKTLEQEVRFSRQELEGIYFKLLEADLSMKTEATDEQLTLDTLIAELALNARRL